MFALYVFRQQITKLNVTQRKVYNGGVLLDKEIVFSKPLDVQNDVPKNINLVSI